MITITADCNLLTQIELDVVWDNKLCYTFDLYYDGKRFNPTEHVGIYTVGLLVTHRNWWKEVNDLTIEQLKHRYPQFPELEHAILESLL